MTEFNNALRKEVERINNEYRNRRSAWGRGVAVYTEELLDNLDNYHIDKTPCNVEELTERLKNGAEDWESYRGTESGDQTRAKNGLIHRQEPCIKPPGESGKHTETSTDRETKSRRECRHLPGIRTPGAASATKTSTHGDRAARRYPCEKVGQREK